MIIINLPDLETCMWKNNMSWFERHILQQSAHLQLQNIWKKIWQQKIFSEFQFWGVFLIETFL